MFTLSLIFLLIGGILLTERLRSIQKRTRSLLHFTELQNDIMEFMRSEGQLLPNGEYKKARKIVEMNNTLINVYSHQRPSYFHILTFFKFLEHFAKPVYDIDKRVQALRPKNENLRKLQMELAETVEWSIFYNTPIYVKLLIMLSISPIIVFLFARKRTKGFHQWYKRVITEQSKEYISENYHIPNFARA